MQTASPSSKRWTFDALSPAERDGVLNMAVVLELSANGGAPVPMLRGKNLAVLCEDSDCPRLASFTQAAAALGAQVTHIRPSETLALSGDFADAVGGLLGLLYDAIECHDMPPDTLERLERITGKPVFNQLACLKPGELPAPHASQFTLQALLLHALS